MYMSTYVRTQTNTVYTYMFITHIIYTPIFLDIIQLAFMTTVGKLSILGFHGINRNNN